MMSGARTPPRFVPTLTTVLEMPPEAATAPPASGDPAPFVPSFPPTPPAPVALADAVALHPREQLSDEAAFRLEEQLLHRVLQRIDLSLEERLSDAVSAAVQEQLDAMVPRLRAEIEGVLRTLVIESLAQELSDSTGSVPASGPRGFS
ncbi:MAG: hypothetical protein EOP81_18210 [Variovorax sp.]|nr:MAG: hypothetical protein EOP81_18210 [Variovorax sp.]